MLMLKRMTNKTYLNNLLVANSLYKCAGCLKTADVV